MATSPDFFPLRARVQYERNPLVEVLCQLRFPTLLRIEGEVPASFQEKIRNRFPIFERELNGLPQNLPDQLVKALGAAMPQSNYQFITENRTSRIHLTSNSIALITNQYEEWEVFKADLDLGLAALTEVYAQSFFERVGLRYRNVVQRSKLGLEDVAWASLLNPSVAGELGEAAWSQRIQSIQKSIRCELNDQGDQLNFQHGFAQLNNQPEICYLLDFDYYYDNKMENNSADAVVERLHSHSGRGFQWAISDQLRVALRPRPN